MTKSFAREWLLASVPWLKQLRTICCVVQIFKTERWSIRYLSDSKSVHLLLFDDLRCQGCCYIFLLHCTFCTQWWYTHTLLKAFFGTTHVSWYQKGKTNYQSGFYWSRRQWRFSRRQCVIDNVHSAMTRSSRLPLSQVSWTNRRHLARSRQITTPAPHHSFLHAGWRQSTSSI